MQLKDRPERVPEPYLCRVLFIICKDKTNVFICQAFHQKNRRRNKKSRKNKLPPEKNPDGNLSVCTEPLLLYKLQGAMHYEDGHYHFVTLNQSASIQPRLVFPAGSKAAKPILAPIHLPSRILNCLPTLVNFLPSRL